MGHEDPHREAMPTPRETRAVPSRVKTRIRWIKFSPEQDTREPLSSLLREILDLVQAYELMESSYPDLSVNVNALTMNESDKAMHDVECYGVSAAHHA